MAEFKLVISDPKSGQSIQRDVKEPNAKSFLGKKIGETIKGELMDLTGFEFQITGGSDYCGFPMRSDLTGTGRKKIFAVSGIGLKKKGKGVKQRKTICGNTVHDKITQINIKILKEGSEKLFEKKEDKKEAKEDKKVEKKEEKVEKKEPEQKKEAEKPAEVKAEPAEKAETKAEEVKAKPADKPETKPEEVKAEPAEKAESKAE